jgi:hypothetical protein
MLITNTLYSQNTIKGKITDQNGFPVPNANVILSDTSKEDIIAYSSTDDKGLYKITYLTTLPEFNIQVSCIDFKTVSENIKNINQNKDFILITGAFELQEVIVQAAPITQRGDTLSYGVKSFSKEMDRTISDVLKRMPGIEVLPDGKILYQGRAISNYYIDGLDLLQGRYNLANENLPHGDVTAVQILENHQSIKMLDSLKFSDNVALNIKLKNAYTFTGQAIVGAGVSPLLYQANVTPIVFTKKGQFLATYQTNNIGDNIASQLNALTIGDLLNNFDGGSGQSSWLSIQQLATPEFSSKRWLDNDVHLLSVNSLHKLNKEYELRINTSYLNDYQQQNGRTKSQFITPNSSITLLEETANQFFSNAFQSNFTVQKNSSATFFKNSLEFEGKWESQRGLIAVNDQNLTQNLNNDYFKISNSLKTIFPLGAQLFTLNSVTSFSTTPQNLAVNPGQFEDILNNGNPYLNVSQNISLQSFFINNSVSVTKGWKQFSFEPRLGFQVEHQNLNTQIITSENVSLGADFVNTLDWTRSKIYFDLQTQYKLNKWQVQLATPVKVHSYSIEDNPLQKKNNFNRVTFEPNLSIAYDLNSFWKFITDINISNQFGTINELHYAYILQNYRSIQRIDAPLPETMSQNISAGINYKNPLKSFFWNLAYANTSNNINLLYDVQILPNGATTLQAIEKNNTMTNQSLISRVSKHFSELKTNITFNASLNRQELQQVLNTTTAEIKNENWNIGGKMDIDVTEQINLEYQTSWVFSRNKIENQYSPTVTQQSHSLNTNFNINKNDLISLKTEYVNNDLLVAQSTNLFADLLYRYTIKKKKIDLEFQINNLFNSTNYQTVSVSNFSYVETNFNLRSRQVTFAIKFML